MPTAEMGAKAQSGAAELAGKGLLGTQPASELKGDRVWKCCHRPRAPGSPVAAGSGRAPKEPPHFCLTGDDHPAPGHARRYSVVRGRVTELEDRPKVRHWAEAGLEPWSES